MLLPSLKHGGRTSCRLIITANSSNTSLGKGTCQSSMHSNHPSTLFVAAHRDREVMLTMSGAPPKEWAIASTSIDQGEQLCFTHEACYHSSWQTSNCSG